jgi:hypothetical protein
MSILDFATYMGVLMSIPYLGFSYKHAHIYTKTILVVFMSILDFGTYMGVLILNIPFFGIS